MCALWQVALGRRLPADGKHVSWCRVRPKAEVVVAEGKLFGQPTVERDNRVIVDL
jgi:hypothetical protein